MNVRLNSDVDICALHPNVVRGNLPPGKELNDFMGPIGFASYTYAQYKDDVESALVNVYGRSNVTRGNKAIDVHNRDRDIDADVVPAFEYRDYVNARTSGVPITGIYFYSDRGEFIYSFPQLHYENGVSKHGDTSRRFKRQVRIQKNLRNHMEDNGDQSAGPIASYLIECLCWNAPDRCYGKADYYDDFESVMKWLYEATSSDTHASMLLEIDGIKTLFGSHNPWTRLQVRSFIENAWETTH